MEKEKTFTSHIEFMVLLITLLGGFYLLDGKIERQGERTDKLYEMFVSAQEEFHKEMRDFHARLERQDAEYKAHLMHQHK